MPKPSHADESAPTQSPSNLVFETGSSVASDTNSYRSGEDEAGEIDVRSLLAPPQSEGELGRLERYRVLKELGRGGMGMVLLAEDSLLLRMAAIKIMLPRYARDPSARERFLREARAAAKINHDNVVRIHQVGEERGIPFIAMEFLKGEPLDQYLKSKGEMSVTQAVRIGREIAEGLHAAHAEGLVHRDIKPANIWLEAPKGRVKILDFGLAREQKDDIHLTKSGAIVGTPACMSPEQAHGQAVDARTDLWSLGVLLYRLCTGRQPFNGPTTMAVLMALGLETPEPVRQRNPQVPVALESLIHRLLSKDASQRPHSAQDVVEALQKFEPSSGGMSKAAAVVYVPLATQVENNPFDGIDDSGYEEPTSASRESLSPSRDAAKGSPGKQRSRRMLFAGLGGVLVLAAAIIIVKITNKDRSVTEVKVPDGSKVEVVNNGMTTVVVDPNQKKDPIAKGEPKRVELPAYVPVLFDEKAAMLLQQEWAVKLKLEVASKSPSGIVMVVIPPGGAALPKPYLLGKYEVTQAEWEKVMGFNPSRFGPKNAKVAGMDTSKFPVEQVSWFDCVEFCNTLSEREGLKAYYELNVKKRGGKDGKQIDEADVKILGGSGYHIPTDTEWEHGCRAGTKTKYHCGDDDKELPNVAWFWDNAQGRTHEVGLLPTARPMRPKSGRQWQLGFLDK